MNTTIGVDNLMGNRFTDDEQIKQILSNKQKLIAFREMVIMHIKKNDIATKILSEDLEKQTNDIILPLSSFKQCLKVIGVSLSPAVSALISFWYFYSNCNDLQSKETLPSTTNTDNKMQSPQWKEFLPRARHLTPETQEMSRAAVLKCDPEWTQWFQTQAI